MEIIINNNKWNNYNYYNSKYNNNYYNRNSGTVTIIIMSIMIIVAFLYGKDDTVY